MEICSTKIHFFLIVLGNGSVNRILYMVIEVVTVSNFALILHSIDDFSQLKDSVTGIYLLPASLLVMHNFGYILNFLNNILISSKDYLVTS